MTQDQKTSQQAEKLRDRLLIGLQAVATGASVPKTLLDTFSNDVLAAADRLSALEGENERLTNLAARYLTAIRWANGEGSDDLPEFEPIGTTRRYSWRRVMMNLAGLTKPRQASAPQP